jgi:hypothetical protein
MVTSKMPNKKAKNMAIGVATISTKFFITIYPAPSPCIFLITKLKHCIKTTYLKRISQLVQMVVLIKLKRQ